MGFKTIGKENDGLSRCKEKVEDYQPPNRTGRLKGNCSQALKPVEKTTKLGRWDGGGPDRTGGTETGQKKLPPNWTKTTSIGMQIEGRQRMTRSDAKIGLLCKRQKGKCRLKNYPGGYRVKRKSASRPTTKKK